MKLALILIGTVLHALLVGYTIPKLLIWFAPAGFPHFGFWQSIGLYLLIQLLNAKAPSIADLKNREKYEDDEDLELRYVFAKEFALPIVWALGLFSGYLYHLAI